VFTGQTGFTLLGTREPTARKKERKVNDIHLLEVTRTAQRIEFRSPWSTAYKFILPAALAETNMSFTGHFSLANCPELSQTLH
jgi:hypothetical protein